VGRVVEVGDDVPDQRLAVGDVVVPVRSNLGTWAQELVCGARDVQKVPGDGDGIPLDQLAALPVCLSTAYRLLEDFVDLREGDVVIQNGAGSAVGQAVIQLAALRGIKSINVIRDTEGVVETAAYLKSIGASVVTTMGSLRQDCAGLPAPALALNCVGGAAAEQVAKQLAVRGTLVTYGGMAKKPVSIPTPLLIFKDVRAKGFWMSGRWYPSSRHTQRHHMFSELCGHLQRGELKIRTSKLPFHQGTTALDNQKPSSRAGLGLKAVLMF